MQNQTILVIQGPGGTDQDLCNLTETARRQDAHLSVLHVGPVKPIPVYSYGGMPYGAVELPHRWVAERQELAAAMAKHRDQSNRFFEREGVSGEAGVICSFPASLDDDVAPRAMLADIAVLQNDLRDNEDAYRNLLFGLLFKSPIGVIINPERAVAPLSPKHVFVAWNTSKPAARAAHAALPILKAADQVTIGTFDAVKKEGADGEDPGADIAKWLSHHGCNVTVQQYETAGSETGEAIRGRATEVGAELIVMGAYGHSRLRQAVFGGTTSTMIAQQDMAVLLAH